MVRTPSAVVKEGVKEGHLYFGWFLIWHKEPGGICLPPNNQECFFWEGTQLVQKKKQVFCIHKKPSPADPYVLWKSLFLCQPHSCFCEEFISSKSPMQAIDPEEFMWMLDMTTAEETMEACGGDIVEFLLRYAASHAKCPMHVETFNTFKEPTPPIEPHPNWRSDSEHESLQAPSARGRFRQLIMEGLHPPKF